MQVSAPYSLRKSEQMAGPPILSAPSSQLEPVRRIKETGERQKAEELAKDDKQNPAVRLRAYLSIGKTPPRELATEENILAALDLEDRVTFLPKLASQVRLIKAEVPLHALLTGLRDAGSRSVGRLTKALYRTTQKWQAQIPTADLNDTSALYFLQILELMSKSRAPSSTKRSPKKASTKNPYIELLRTGTKWVALSANPALLLPLLKVLTSAERSQGTKIEELAVNNAEFAKDLADLMKRTLDRCEELVQKGMIPEFHELTEALSAFPAISGEFKARMSKLYSQKSRFPASVQDALRAVVGDQVEAPTGPRIQVDEEDSVQTMQLASALIAAWTAKDEGTKSKDAYEELKAVAANFFGLELHGNANEVETYNPRIHEFVPGTKPSARVRLLGPWVDFSRGVISKVILKAPVEPA
jgi:hypothetical protein